VDAFEPMRELLVIQGEFQEAVFTPESHPPIRGLRIADLAVFV
jgi:hypothetical protein